LRKLTTMLAFALVTLVAACASSTPQPDHDAVAVLDTAPPIVEAQVAPTMTLDEVLLVSAIEESLGLPASVPEEGFKLGVPDTAIPPPTLLKLDAAECLCWEDNGERVDRRSLSSSQSAPKLPKFIATVRGKDLQPLG